MRAIVPDLERWRASLRARREAYRASHPESEWATETQLPCPACEGTGWQREQRPNGAFARCVVCRPPREATGPTLAGYIVQGGNEAGQLEATYALNRAIMAAETGQPRLLVFAGPPGVGKTHLARAVLAERISKGESGQLWLASELIEWLRDTQGDQSHLPPEERVRLSQRLDHLRRLRWLVIDDLGMERQTPWGIEQLETIIDRRYTDLSGLVVTTNYDLTRMDSPFSARIRSRLGDRRWGEIVSLSQVPDYRRRRV